MWIASPTSRATASASVHLGRRTSRRARRGGGRRRRSSGRRPGSASPGRRARRARRSVCDPAELRIVELGSRRSTSPIATVRRSRAARFETGKPVGDVADRRRPGGVPLGARSASARRLAEADEAAVDADARAGLLDRDAEHGVEVELRANLARDRATIRSRSSASASASAERTRSSASAASAASAWSSGELVPVEHAVARRRRRRAPRARCSREMSGTNTALFAPTCSASGG